MLSAVNALNVDHPVTLGLRRGFEIVERTEVSNDDSYTLQLDAFAAAVEAGGPFLISGAEGLRNQQVLDTAFRSIKSGKTESVADARTRLSLAKLLYVEL